MRSNHEPDAVEASDPTCPRCHSPIELGVAQACRRCGLALGADGGIPRLLDSEAPWPDVIPRADFKQLAKSWLAISGIVSALLALAIGILSVLSSGPARDNAEAHLISRPEAVASLGSPVRVRLTFQTLGPRSRDPGPPRRSFLTLMSGPHGFGLGRVSTLGNGSSVGLTDAAFRRLSEDWIELSRLRPLGLAPPQVISGIQQARAQLQAERPREALQSIDGVLALAPRWSESWYVRALAARGVGDLEQARGDALRALELEHADHGVVTLAIELLPEGAGPRAAIELWNRFLLAYPDDPNARVELAFAQTAAGDLGLARATFQKYCVRGHARACDGLQALDEGTVTPAQFGGPIQPPTDTAGR